MVESSNSLMKKDEGYCGLGMDALVIIMVWAWML